MTQPSIGPQSACRKGWVLAQGQGLRRGGVAGSHEEKASKAGVVGGSNGRAAGQGGSERLILATILHPSFAIDVGVGFS